MHARAKSIASTVLAVLLAYLVAPWIFEGWMIVVPRLRSIWYIEMLWHGSVRWVSVYAVMWASALWQQLIPQPQNQHPVAKLGGRLLFSFLLVQIGILYLIVVNPQFWHVARGWSLSPTVRTGWSSWHLIEVPVNVLTWIFGISIFVDKSIQYEFNSEMSVKTPVWLWVLLFGLFYWGVSRWGIYRRRLWKGSTESEQSWLRLVYWGGFGWFVLILYLSSYWLFLGVGNRLYLLLTAMFWKEIGFCILLLMGLCLSLTVGLLAVKRRGGST
jgi:hypothetical protein